MRQVNEEDNSPSDETKQTYVDGVKKKRPWKTDRNERRAEARAAKTVEQSASMSMVQDELVRDLAR